MHHPHGAERPLHAHPPPSQGETQVCGAPRPHLPSWQTPRLHGGQTGQVKGQPHKHHHVCGMGINPWKEEC